MKKGEFFGLLGESGAGKTSTFQIITSEIFASSGDVLINDVSVKNSVVGYIHHI
jgi:ABC-type multidrug transport system ATPase subunit